VSQSIDVTTVLDPDFSTFSEELFGRNDRRMLSYLLQWSCVFVGVISLTSITNFHGHQRAS